jgi:hypothetical protein
VQATLTTILSMILSSHGPVSPKIRLNHPGDGEHWLWVNVLQTALLVCTNLTKLAIGQRLREDAIVDEAERIPLRRAFGFEVPEHPTITSVSNNSQTTRKSNPVLKLTSH